MADNESLRILLKRHSCTAKKIMENCQRLRFIGLLYKAISIHIEKVIKRQVKHANTYLTMLKMQPPHLRLDRV